MCNLNEYTVYDFMYWRNPRSYTLLISSNILFRNIEMKSIKIYTRTGDKGTTSLFTGQRLSKTNIVFHCMGTVDELTSLIGISKEYCPESCSLKDQLYKIQCCLQDINSHIATPPYHAVEAKKIRTTFDHGGRLSNELEQWIDEMDKELPVLKNFILPVSI